MRNPLLLLFAATILSLPVIAQTTYSYNFNNDLKEQSGTGPDLIAICPGSYSSESLPTGTTKNVYHYPHGCGLIFDDSIGGFLASGSYTVQMYIRLDSIGGFKKLIDYTIRRADSGFYNQSGHTNFYSCGESDSTFMKDSVYAFISVSRDASSKICRTYVNGQLAKVDTDNKDGFAYDFHKKLYFFVDDQSTSFNEETGGTVAYLFISDYAMDTTILARNLAVPNTSANDDIRFYPNPVNDYLHIKVPRDYDYSVCDITGRQLISSQLQTGNNSIYLGKLNAGMYLLMLSNDDGSRIVYKIMKE
jgi:hypothetical protein